MDYTTPFYQNSHLLSYSEEGLPQEASPTDPNAQFVDPCCASNASNAWSPFGPTSFPGTTHEIHSLATDWSVDVMRMDSASWPVQTDRLEWSQHDDSAPSSSNVYPAQSVRSAFDARSNNTTSSSAPSIGDTSVSLPGHRNYDQSYASEYYAATIDPARFSPPCSEVSMPHNDFQGCFSFLYPPAQVNEPRPGTFAGSPPWFYPYDSPQLLDDVGSHLRLYSKTSSHPLPTQYDMDVDLCYTGQEAAIDLDSISSVPYEPDIEILDGASTRLSCDQHGCKAQFNTVADHKRHIKTIHKEGQSYMCAYVGCVRAYKVWRRLDSFKNHAKLHKPDDIEALVAKSRKEDECLRVAVTTQGKLRRCRPNELDSHLSRSHEYY